jgi:hypothetical protein
MGLAAHTMGLAALTIGLAALLVEFLGLGFLAMIENIKMKVDQKFPHCFLAHLLYHDFRDFPAIS